MGPRETDLYPPLKAFLEAQGYEVKGEVGAVDLVAVRGDAPPVLIEMKLGFSLALVHQGIDRQAMSDLVYLAVPRPRGGISRRNVTLCRKLGLGLIEVRLRDGHVSVHCDPARYVPRRFPDRTDRLLREFARLAGDPNVGGGTRRGLVTAYRQDALRCANHLAANGPSKGSEVALATGAPAATRIMRDNHYGWFERLGAGIYRLAPKGSEVIKMGFGNSPNEPRESD